MRMLLTTNMELFCFSLVVSGEVFVGRLRLDAFLPSFVNKFRRRRQRVKRCEACFICRLLLSPRCRRSPWAPSRSPRCPTP